MVDDDIDANRQLYRFMTARSIKESRKKRRNFRNVLYAQIITGLSILRDETPTVSENLDLRLKVPGLLDYGNNVTPEDGLPVDFGFRRKGGMSPWSINLASRTFIAYGKKAGAEYDNRNRFKIYHADKAFLESIVNEEMNHGAIRINENRYETLPGPEYIIIDMATITGIDDPQDRKFQTAYAINADNYQSIRAKLNQHECSLDELKEAGAFAVNQWVSPQDIIHSKDSREISDITSDDISYIHEGWLQLCVGENDPSEEHLSIAVKILTRYVIESEKLNVLSSSGRRMAFFVNTQCPDYHILPFTLGNIATGSPVNGKNTSFHFRDYFVSKPRPDQLINF